MYLTYEEYKEMGGTLDAPTFEDLEFQAEALVNWYTFNRLSKDVQIPLAVKRLIKYLIGTIHVQNGTIQAESGGNGSSASIASQSNDGVSISHNVLSAAELMATLKSAGEEAIRRYLQGVTNEAGRLLLYRGLYPGE